MPFKHNHFGYFYSKIYDFNAGERFNLTSGKIDFIVKKQSTGIGHRADQSIFIQIFSTIFFISSIFFGQILYIS